MSWRRVTTAEIAGLMASDVQWYWPGADRSNVLPIMKRRAEAYRRSAPVGAG